VSAHQQRVAGQAQIRLDLPRPTGAVLSAERRAAVLRWARKRRALVIEDDYDAEYRYDRAPIGAMQGLAPDLVAYAGTASKNARARAAIGLARRTPRPRRRHRRRQEAR
jgi:GntR family transcriptional regulator/MocR family aminotransferase